MTPEGMVPPTNRARIVRIDLQLVLKDFLNTRSGHPAGYTLPPSDAVLRQETLPEDAAVLWARLDQDDTAREDALRAAREFAMIFAGGEHDHLAAPLAAQLDAALAAPPGRHLVVAIESAAFDAVPLGAEPEEAFDYLAYFPAKEEE